jgi:hypothetical protein
LARFAPEAVMFRSLWFHRLLSLRRSRNVRRRESAQERRTIRPHLEGLEDRLTPSGGPPLPLDTPASGAELQPDLNWVHANPTSEYTINLDPQAPSRLPDELTTSGTGTWTLDGNGATLHVAALNPLFSVTVENDVAGINLDGFAGDGPSTLRAALASGAAMAELGDGIYVSQGGSLTLRSSEATRVDPGQDSLPFGSDTALSADGGADVPTGGEGEGGGGD